MLTVQREMMDGWGDELESVKERVGALVETGEREGCQLVERKRAECWIEQSCERKGRSIE